MRFQSKALATLAAFVLTVCPFKSRANVSVAVLPASQAALVSSNAVFTAQVTASAGETVTDTL